MVTGDVFMCRAISLIMALCVSLFSFQASAEEKPAFEISAPSAVLMDYTTGKILYEKNPDEKRPLASVTKIMTMLIAMEEIDAGRMSFDDIVTASEHAKSYGGSTIFLDAGEQMSVSDIMKGIAVASGNDAAVAMGEHISGSEEAFVRRMNQRAAELGMKNTNFINCNGLDAEGHYSTARDISIMSRELMKHPGIFSYTTIWMDSLRNGEFTLTNTNKLVRFYSGATGLKTGSTSKAGFCVSATAKRDNMHLIAVIMGAETSKKRQADASALLNHGFSSYGVCNVIDENTVVKTLKVNKGIKESVDVKTSKSCDYLYKKGDNTKYETKLRIKTVLNAPVKYGEHIGDMDVFVGETQIDRIPVVCADDVPKKIFSDFFREMCALWIYA